MKKMSNGNKEKKFDRNSIDMGLPIIIIIIFIITLFINQLFYAIAAAGILYVGIHAVHYFKNRLEYSKKTLAEISRQNELLLELIRRGRNEK
ncbi:MAG: hypothetical protein SCH70_13905 [Candidatus Methanoperedens sp.]|nr:hypothetical protein [Candidatus Methanoperedens sp.]